MPTQNKPPVKKPVPVTRESTPRTKPLQLKAPFHFTGRNFTFIFILSVIALCFLQYSNSIPNEFSLDDEFVLHNDTIVAKGIKGIPELFKTRYAWDQKGSYGYRPIVKVTFSLEYVFFKDSAHWGHFINILIYAFACIFLFFFFRKLLYNQVSDYFLLITFALYITLPIHSEVVVSLKNRDELLELLFGFYCFHATMKWIDAEKAAPRFLWGLSGCLSLGLGTLCKPDAIIFIPVIAVILFFFSPKGIRGAILAFFCLSIFILYGNVFMHRHVLPHSDYHRTYVYIENPLVGVHWYQKFPLAFSTVWFYVSKMIFPKDLICYYGYDAFDSFPHWTDFGVIAGMLLTGICLYFISKNWKKKNSILFFLLLSAGTLFPYTDLLQVAPGIVAERFMLIPSIFFLFLVTYILFYALKIPVAGKLSRQSSTYAYAFTIAVCILFTARVIARNPDWKTHQSVYLHDSRTAPRSAKLQALLAATYIDDAQRMKITNPQKKSTIDSLFLAGENAYQRSVDIYPGYGTSWNNLGMIQYTLYNNVTNGISDFKKALHIDSTYSEAWFNMGVCYDVISTKLSDTIKSLRHDSAQIDDKKIRGYEPKVLYGNAIQAKEIKIHQYRDESEKCYLKTIMLKPTYYLAYIYLARLYFSESKYDKVLEFDNNAISLGYKSDVVYVTMGNAYLMMKDTSNAVVNYEKSFRFYDRNYYVCGFLKKYYEGKGDVEKARYYGEKYQTAMMYMRNNKQPH